MVVEAPTDMMPAFALGFVQIGTVADSQIGVESRTESRIEKETGMGIKIETRIETDVNRCKRRRNPLYIHAGAAAGETLRARRSQEGAEQPGQLVV
ncbi:hypothetical protein EVAR_78234_1 [Eumeta japonica]|uniref:Uncharacterized protein n=1 Tax=Eumeta variegata TaxID=151549 RepID=A0A4C1T5I2_EUMVA|nr:hypothetical protein EVAR_78234_1 [Eumeta japonica]